MIASSFAGPGPPVLEATKGQEIAPDSRAPTVDKLTRAPISECIFDDQVSATAFGLTNIVAGEKAELSPWTACEMLTDGGAGV
jgi:hypothetical protein